MTSNPSGHPGRLVHGAADVVLDHPELPAIASSLRSWRRRTETAPDDFSCLMKSSSSSSRSEAASAHRKISARS